MSCTPIPVETAMLCPSNATLPIAVRQQRPRQAPDLRREALNETWAVYADAYGHDRQGCWTLGGLTSELLSGG
ncbi:hypothetical protein [Reyranella sp.]|uniref:hypothetical protein n=1 Tax=Reyranella sp. TaxID=1929291 RepID=UPI003C7E8EE7